ncbi:MAG TPA: glycosyltransferase [Gemmataceae bacterium]|nr:glycosyltransferase [Gemmataceae bacterium]
MACDVRVPRRRPPRLLFCSYHCYWDPSSGAAVCSRELLELLARRDWACRVLCGPRLDFEMPTRLDQILAAQQCEFELRQAAAAAGPLSVFRFRQAGVAVQVYGSPFGPRLGPPTPEEGVGFLALCERVLEHFQPDVVLTYGGDWVTRELIGLAKERGIRVVFALHNLAYQSGEPFRQVDAVLVPSRFAQAHYRRTIGLESTPIPGPWNWDRLRCESVEGRYVTFVNPQPQKGVFLFARIAVELARRRPDIPLLVVEGRATAKWLQATGLDLAALGNISVMANTPDPRAFYRLSRIVLLPSLGSESFPRVPVEAFLNGIPVLANRIGGVPEVLEQAGFLFDVPQGYTPSTRQVPSAMEMAPWIETIIRLWDDPPFYAEESRRCRAAAEAWRPERLLPRFEEVLAPGMPAYKPEALAKGRAFLR